MQYYRFHLKHLEEYQCRILTTLSELWRHLPTQKSKTLAYVPTRFSTASMFNLTINYNLKSDSQWEWFLKWKVGFTRIFLANRYRARKDNLCICSIAKTSKISNYWFDFHTNFSFLLRNTEIPLMKAMKISQ